MARKKISEFRAKTILFAALEQPYVGLAVDSRDADWQNALVSLPNETTYVVKVDQAVKGRFKKGLVLLDHSKDQLSADMQSFFDQGYQYALVEPYQTYDQAAERYLAIARVRDGLQLSFSESGGVDIEAHPESIQTVVWDMVSVLPPTPFPEIDVERIVQAFQGNYCSFLEINPLLVESDQIIVLDAAVEVDGEADFFASGWIEADLRRPPAKANAPQVDIVRELDAESQASFALEVINPNGSIFLLLSGGGASVVVADEVSNLGYGTELGNYGEYSGNPNTEETAHYTAQVLELLLASSAPRKALIIGGGVANFTDIRQTFKGVVRAIDTYKDQLQAQDVAMYVRRGGPHEKQGLETLDRYLLSLRITHEVYGPEIILTDIVKRALERLR